MLRISIGWHYHSLAVALLSIKIPENAQDAKNVEDARDAKDAEIAKMLSMLKMLKMLKFLKYARLRCSSSDAENTMLFSFKFYTFS